MGRHIERTQVRAECDLEILHLESDRLYLYDEGDCYGDCPICIGQEEMAMWRELREQTT